MEFISLVFRLGVVLAIFSFIWALIRFGLAILRGGLPMPYPLGLLLKLIQYFLIVDITILFCTSRVETMELDTILAGFILLMYFFGKVQNMRSRFMMVQIQGIGRPQQQQQEPPRMRLEFGVIALSMALFVFLAIRPDLAVNNAATWFYENIMEIERAPIFGFIFRVIGFFFTLSILFRMVSAFMVILSGQAFNTKGPQDNNDRNQRNDNRFDDYEEVE
jgi:hypothetical protein